jgi:hypothetical protein
MYPIETLSRVTCNLVGRHNYWALGPDNICGIVDMQGFMGNICGIVNSIDQI